MDKRCGTCAYFEVPKAWEGTAYWERTQTQLGVCNYPTPKIPKIIDYTRSLTAGCGWTNCPCWTENVMEG